MNTMFLALLASLLLANPVRLLELRAYQTSAALNEVKVEWSVQNEDAVDRFIVRRKMQRDADFVQVSEVESRGTGSYSFSDKNVYKASDNAEMIVYAIVVVKQDGSRELLGQANVQYSASTVRRTWGSIKAMFQ
jgi:hypothetical protein